MCVTFVDVSYVDVTCPTPNATYLRVITTCFLYIIAGTYFVHDILVKVLHAYFMRIHVNFL